MLSLPFFGAIEHKTTAPVAIDRDQTSQTSIVLWACPFVPRGNSMRFGTGWLDNRRQR
jgi:hypothetical protein